MEKSASKPLIVLPTYNNAGTLGEVLEGALLSAAGNRVLVVNDGSTDATAEILGRYPEAVVMDLGENRGKGEALLAGFHYARVNGYSHVISMDTDGQHLATDLPKFLKAIEEDSEAVWLGDRGLLSRHVPNAPRSSIFGCRFSNFWVSLETGLRLADTQTGFRAYPLARSPVSSLRSKRYDFEIEILVRFAWRGARIRSLPIGVVYAPRGQRVSHFNLWVDNARLTIVHTRICTLRILSIPARLLAARRALAPSHSSSPSRSPARREQNET